MLAVGANKHDSKGAVWLLPLPIPIFSLPLTIDPGSYPSVIEDSMSGVQLFAGANCSFIGTYDATIEIQDAEDEDELFMATNTPGAALSVDGHAVIITNQDQSGMQQAVRNTRMRSLGEPKAGNRTIRVSIQEGADSVQEVMLNVNVVTVNDNPVVSMTAIVSPAQVTEGDENGSSIFAGIIMSDAENHSVVM